MKKFFIVLSSVFLLNCGSNTSIVSSWRDPDTTISQEQFKKVLVVALLKDEATRRTTENRIAATKPELFRTSYQIFNKTNLELTPEQKLSILKSENFDGVVTMRLVSTEKETEYVPGTNTSLYYGGMYGGAYGYGFNSWYGYYSPVYYDPGYYQENTYYIVETNIFSVNRNKLIWTGTTKSSDISDLGLTVDNIIRTVYEEMKKDGSVVEPKK